MSNPDVEVRVDHLAEAMLSLGQILGTDPDDWTKATLCEAIMHIRNEIARRDPPPFVLKGQGRST